MKKHFLTVAVVLSVSVPAWAGSHLWQVNELFSNVDGTIQFVELRNPTTAANETALNGKWVLSVVTGSQFFFPANLPAGSTAQKHLLLGTAAFAALPGAPTPDHIIPENFFDLDADEIEYWNYTGQELVFTSGQLPLNGVDSLDRNGTVAANSPTNFAGDSGSVDAGTGDVPTVSQWGLMCLAALLLVVGTVVVARRGGRQTV